MTATTQRRYGNRVRANTCITAILATTAIIVAAGCTTPKPAAAPRQTAAQACRQAARELGTSEVDLTAAQARTLQHQLHATAGTKSMAIWNDLGMITQGDSDYTAVGSLESDCATIGVKMFDGQ